MTIERGNGSIFDCGADVTCVPVNCVGVAGKGLALEAKRRWPAWFKAYAETCNMGGPHAGSVWPHHRFTGDLPKVILNVATKRHWRSQSTILAVGQCLANIRAWALRTQTASVAIPALGCGCGGLKWTDVLPMIEHCFDPEYAGVDINFKVIVFDPQ